MTLTVEKSFNRTPYFFIAMDEEKVIGLIRGYNGLITNLFVDKQYHKKGIASKLLTRFENISQKNGINKIKLNASLYAVGFYQKMGYKKTTGIRNMQELTIQPMQKYFDLLNDMM